MLVLMGLPLKLAFSPATAPVPFPLTRPSRVVHVSMPVGVAGGLGWLLVVLLPSATSSTMVGLVTSTVLPALPVSPGRRHITMIVLISLTEILCF